MYALNDVIYMLFIVVVFCPASLPRKRLLSDVSCLPLAAKAQRFV